MSSIVMLLLCSAVVGVVGSTGEGRNPNFLATENSNLEVLKELGMDIQNEGKNEQTYFFAVNYLVLLIELSKTQLNLTQNQVTPKKWLLF